MKLKKIFFPFSHITDRQTDAVLSFFPEFDYLSLESDPAGQGAVALFHERGRIHPLFPEPGEMQTIDRTSSQYMEWADMHQGNESNLKTLWTKIPYLKDDMDVAGIKSRLRNPQVDESDEPEEFPWQKALLFLKMARICDAQHDSINRRLNTIDQARDDLITVLRGDGDLFSKLPESTAEETDPGDRMTAERIMFWAGYMAYKRVWERENTPPLFVTTSPAVFESLESNCKDVINPLDIKQIKVHENECENQNQWHHQFNQHIERAIKGNECRETDLPRVDDECDLMAQLKLGLFSGDKINRYFNINAEQIPVCLVRLK